MGSEGVPPEHQMLLAQIRAGDEAAFAALLRLHSAPLEHYVRRQLPNDLAGACDVPDVLQDIYLEAFRRIGEFAAVDSTSIQRWLTTIARNRIVDVVRHHRALKRGGGARIIGENQNQSGDDMVPMLQQLAVYERTPSQSALSHEQHLLVQCALDRLRPVYRDVLRMRYLASLPIDEIALRMNRGARAVQMLCHRALNELRREMERKEPFAGD